MRVVGRFLALLCYPIASASVVWWQDFPRPKLFLTDSLKETSNSSSLESSLHSPTSVPTTTQPPTANIPEADLNLDPYRPSSVRIFSTDELPADCEEGFKIKTLMGLDLVLSFTLGVPGIWGIGKSASMESSPLLFTFPLGSRRFSNSAVFIVNTA